MLTALWGDTRRFIDPVQMRRIIIQLASCPYFSSLNVTLVHDCLQLIHIKKILGGEEEKNLIITNACMFQI